MSGWWLAVDFGTSFTTAAYRAPGAANAELLEIDGSRYLPSVVCLDEDGGLLVGRAAVSRATVFPERAERTPKRALVAGDHARLGGMTVETVRLVAAVLERVGEEARLRFDGAAPDGVVLTHPVRWGQRELELLASAAARTGLPAPRFLPEPVAAARHYLELDALPPGACVAVYDLGGGTLDTAVLRRTADGFDVVGQPGGNPHFGGEDLTNALFSVVRHHATAMDPAGWEKIWAATDRTGLRAQQQWRAAVNEGKELLSSSTTTTVFETGFESGLRITRSEYEAAIDSMLRSSVYELRATIDRADTPPDRLAAIYLTGGASRTPKVSDLIAEIIGILPTTSGDPKTAIVLGAIATVGTSQPSTAAARIVPPPPPVGPPHPPPPVPPRTTQPQRPLPQPTGQPPPFARLVVPTSRATTPPGAAVPPAGLLSARPATNAVTPPPRSASALPREALWDGPSRPLGDRARLRVWWRLCGVGTLVAVVLWLVGYIGMLTAGAPARFIGNLAIFEFPFLVIPALVGVRLLLRRAAPDRRPVNGALWVVGAAAYGAMRGSYDFTVVATLRYGTLSWWFCVNLTEEALLCLLGIVCLTLACVDGTLRLRRPRIGPAGIVILCLAVANSCMYGYLCTWNPYWTTSQYYLSADETLPTEPVHHMFTAMVVLAVVVPLLMLIAQPSSAQVILGLGWLTGMCANIGYDFARHYFPRHEPLLFLIGGCVVLGLLTGLFHADVRRRSRQQPPLPPLPPTTAAPVLQPPPIQALRPPRRTRGGL